MLQRPRQGRVSVRAGRLVSITFAAGVVVGCGTISTSAPAPTPADFPGIAGNMAQRGIAISHIVSGDPGCSNPDLGKTAIAFDGTGLDQATPVRLYVYIFRNRETYERLRSSVDSCARSYVTNPESYESVETSPFVLSGQGPWGPQFKENLRTAIVEAAGTGD